jgi:hypothetical protein
LKGTQTNGVPVRLIAVHDDGSSIDVASMVDVDDIDAFELFVYGVDDPVAATAGGAQTGPLSGQLTAYPKRLFGQGTEDELQTRSADLLWKSEQVTFGASRDGTV